MSLALRRSWPGRRGWIALAVVAIVLAVATALMVRAGVQHGLTTPAQDQLSQTQAQAAVVALPPPDQLRPLTPQEAMAANRQRASAARPDQAAPAFKPKFVDGTDRLRALDCLTQAVYYEAATEPLEGREAVAQVILNRVHHPAFPNSVCGVVYQGSERPTGCQFTFTCDGALHRTPVGSLWNQARKVAVAALAGKVFAPVGHATHYHADYVLPYWADSLDKEVQIGRHIFYRLKNGLGSPRAFSQGYRGREQLPLTATDLEVAAKAAESAAGLASEPSFDEALTVVPPPAGPKPPPILADLAHGHLVLDDDGAESRLISGNTKPLPTSSMDCQTHSPNQVRSRPMDNRSGHQTDAACP